MREKSKGRTKSWSAPDTQAGCPRAPAQPTSRHKEKSCSRSPAVPLPAPQVLFVHMARLYLGFRFVVSTNRGVPSVSATRLRDSQWQPAQQSAGQHVPFGLTQPVQKHCNLLQRLFQRSQGCNPSWKVCQSVLRHRFCFLP